MTIHTILTLIFQWLMQVNTLVYYAMLSRTTKTVIQLTNKDFTVPMAALRQEDMSLAIMELLYCTDIWLIYMVGSCKKGHRASNVYQFYQNACKFPPLAKNKKSLISPIKHISKTVFLTLFLEQKVKKNESQEVTNFYRSFVGVFKQFIQVAIYGCSSFIVLNFSVTSGPARPVFCRGTVFVTFRVYQSVSVHYWGWLNRRVLLRDFTWFCQSYCCLSDRAIGFFLCTNLAWEAVQWSLRRTSCSSYTPLYGSWLGL